MFASDGACPLGLYEHNNTILKAGAGCEAARKQQHEKNDNINKTMRVPDVSAHDGRARPHHRQPRALRVRREA